MEYSLEMDYISKNVLDEHELSTFEIILDLKKLYSGGHCDL